MPEGAEKFQRFRRIMAAARNQQAPAEPHSPDPSPSQNSLELFAREMGRRPVLRAGVIVGFLAGLGSGLGIGINLARRAESLGSRDLEPVEKYVHDYASAFAGNVIDLYGKTPYDEETMAQYETAQSRNVYLKLAAFPATDGTEGEYALHTFLKTASGKPTTDDVQYIELAAFTNRSETSFRTIQPGNPNFLYRIAFAKQPDDHWTISVHTPTPADGVHFSKDYTTKRNGEEGKQALDIQTFASISAAMTQAYGNAVSRTPVERSTAPAL